MHGWSVIRIGRHSTDFEQGMFKGFCLEKDILFTTKLNWGASVEIIQIQILQDTINEGELSDKN